MARLSLITQFTESDIGAAALTRLSIAGWQVACGLILSVLSESAASDAACHYIREPGILGAILRPF